MGQVDAGDGKIIPIKEEVEIKGTSQLDEANKKFNDLYRQEQNVRKEMEKIVSANNKITFKHTAGYSPTAPTVVGGGAGGGNTDRTPAPTDTDKDKKTLQGSIDWYEEKIRELQKQMQATANEETAKALNAELEGLQRSLYMLKVKVGVETPAPIEVKKQVQPMREQIEEAFEDMQQYLKQNPIQVETNPEKLKKLADSMKDLENIKGLSNIDLTSFESVRNALVNIQAISNPTAQGFAAAGTACQALGGAMQQLGADSAAAKAGMVMAALGQLALSFATAMSDAARQSWVTWLAFGVAGTAQLVSMVATLSQFATGGIVGGNQTSGDKVLVRVNSGEMILNAAQQARLFALANGAAVYGASAQVASDFARGAALPSVQVNASRLQDVGRESGQMNMRLRLRGRDLVGAIANETRSNRRRSNIRI